MQIDQNTNKQQVAEIILDHLNEILAGKGDIPCVQIDTDLIAKGLLDSLNIVRLIQFLEAKFSIYIDDDDISPELFQSVNHLTDYVMRQR